MRSNRLGRALTLNWREHCFTSWAAVVGIWKLRDNLKDRNDDNYWEASNIGMLLHEEILETASKAVSRLRAHPNQRLLKLLIAHLETYPYSWTQEGYEDLLPNLKKLQNTRKK